jgi:hypothetical protein
MRRRILPLALAALAHLHALPALATTVSINPSKDNTLIQTTDPNNQLSNGQGDIFVGRTNQDGNGPATVSIRRGLIDFNVAASGIPAGATITAVTLTMRDVMGLNGAQTLSLHDVTQNWGQGSSFSNGGTGAPAQQNDATWLYTFYNAANPSASPQWTTPGGDFGATVSGSTVDNAAAGGLVTWSSATNPQMVADVQNWLNNPANNFGWIMLGNESVGQTAKRLNGMEATTPPAQPPLLTITYTVPEPASIVSVLLGAAACLVFGCKRSGQQKTKLNPVA